MPTFNIANDLAEKNELSKQYPELVKGLADKLEKPGQSGRSLAP
ncbi:hypothetical protein PQO03_13870 [Lentisphaera profundi]|uniref:Uncharacterized protein n=1 Tax=Lentisphaera profundi TaxID=1658616 RepID=A0ABY7W1C5_9BACT|nr:hypothetical protein [Lentisphaera profundi]WDE98922.1 hypothetical protein PQO03_13870 [Lentisphaera profundi]